MNRIFPILILFALMSSPISAQEVILEGPCNVIAAKGVSDTGTEVASADYVPGVDVKGKPVAAADLNGLSSATQFPIEVPIDIDVVRWLELDVPPAVEEAGEIRPTLATLSVHKDGSVEYNGVDVSDKVDARCAGNQVDVSAEVTKEDRQTAEETVTSEPEDQSDIIEGQAQ